VTPFPQPYPRRRATRLELTKPVKAVVVDEEGRRTPCRLKTVSATGGLLALKTPLTNGDFVEITFPTNLVMVRGMAEVMVPFTRNGRLFQPFRFVALDDLDHRALRTLTDIANYHQPFLSASALRHI
jgi:hypothetical protein